MRKLSAVLLPVAAVGALVASTLAVAGPAAADSWGRGDYGYGRYERPVRFDGYRRFDRSDRSDRSDRFDRSDRVARFDRFDRYRYERRGDWDRGDWGRRDGGYRYGDHRWR